MTKKSIRKPHDLLFKSALKHLEVSREFLELYLPENIKNNLDFNSIVYCPNQFISDQLTESESDVLLQCNISGKEAFIFILAEHQSTIDPLMPFRLVHYMTCIWDDYRKKVGDKNTLPLPFIFPLVFFTGQGPYTGKRTIWELFGDQADAMKSLLQNPFHLIDVGSLTEEELTTHPWAGTLGFILRKQFKKNLRQQLKKIAQSLNTIGLAEEGKYLVELFYYIINVDKQDITLDGLVEIIHDELSPGVEHKIMNLAERLREEGVIKGKLDTAKEMLALGSDVAFVQKVTKLPLEQIKSLQQK